MCANYWYVAGSMRGARETVAKALALECMRAAKAQERGCFVFAFAGPQEVSNAICPAYCALSNLPCKIPPEELVHKSAGE